MQKLCFILFGIIITTGAFAADLCVRNDAMVVAMNPDINGTSSSSTLKTWSVKFNYGTLTGVSSCHNDDCQTGGCIANNQNMGLNDIGNGCYCRMLRPSASQWIYSGSYMGPSTGRCTGGGCASACANIITTSIQFREQLFGSLNAVD